MNKCVDCGKEIWRGSTRCRSCAKKGKRNSNKNGNSGSFQKGQIPWNKDTKGLQEAWNKGVGICHVKGYTGCYKQKLFNYAVKLPKNAVRHHVVYRDSNPNYGIIFCTRSYHAWIHSLSPLSCIGRRKTNG